MFAGYVWNLSTINWIPFEKAIKIALEFAENKFEMPSYFLFDNSYIFELFLPLNEL